MTSSDPSVIAGRIIGSIVGVCIFAGVLTAISAGFGKLVGKPLTRAQKISTFIVCSVVFVAAVIYERYHS